VLIHARVLMITMAPTTHARISISMITATFAIIRLEVAGQLFRDIAFKLARGAQDTKQKHTKRQQPSRPHARAI